MPGRTSAATQRPVVRIDFLRPPEHQCLRSKERGSRAGSWGLVRVGRQSSHTTGVALVKRSSPDACDGRDAPKKAVPLSWVERVRPSMSTQIQTRVRVSPDCSPSSRPGRDRELGTAMIYASRFIPYRVRGCAADRRRSDGHPVPQALHFSNTEHCENLRQIPGASGSLSRVREADRRARRSLISGPLRLELVRQAA